MNIIRKIRFYIKKYYPKNYANFLYKRQFGRGINWKNPTEFNEKLRWLQFNTDTSIWTLLADKYRVRQFIKDKGYDEILVKLYGVWHDPREIDFDSLPNRFVLKTNHGSGSVYIIKDKATINKEVLLNKLSSDIKLEYGVLAAEPHYLHISPVVMAEELLEQDGKESNSLIDYKFYCVNGQPVFCGVMYNRDIISHNYSVRLYDNDWNDISHLLDQKVNRGKHGISKPINFDAMKEFCRNVCKDFPFVRMDFYECNGRLYFGEFTFTPAACTGGSLGKEACKILADKIQIPK